MSELSYAEKKQENLDDEQLVRLAKEGDESAFEDLIIRYKGNVLSKARTYFLIGADREDIIQEGMIGLVKAIRDYKEEKAASFRVFADICITRQIITAVKTATRQKHKPLNTYISLSRPMYDDDNENRTLVDMLESDISFNPEENMIVSESYHGISSDVMGVLSNFEKKVLDEYLCGKSYQQISEEIKKTPKSIDNALQRIKRKLEKYYEGKR
ncbi:MAG: RNA polymerase sporulation sigma factor SigH [Clostridia bacterium]|nr:RNA polymerase sporulation sigma factor SigH [Clostridia bacterium]